MEQSSTVKVEHIRPAIAVGGYLEASVAALFHDFAKTRGKELEDKVTAHLKNLGKPVSQRDLYRALTVSARELQGILEPLLKLGIVRSRPVKTDGGRNVVLYEL
jgi:hypothetical protein